MNVLYKHAGRGAIFETDKLYTICIRTPKGLHLLAGKLRRIVPVGHRKFKRSRGALILRNLLDSFLPVLRSALAKDIGDLNAAAHRSANSATV